MLFLRLIQMIIAPLVLRHAGRRHRAHGRHGALGRVGVRTLLWFISASISRCCSASVWCTLLQPGVGFALPLPRGDAASGWSTGLAHLRTSSPTSCRRSIFDAMATNEILQIVVFSAVLRRALAALGERAAMRDGSSPSRART